MSSEWLPSKDDRIVRFSVDEESNLFWVLIEGFGALRQRPGTETERYAPYIGFYRCLLSTLGGAWLLTRDVCKPGLAVRERPEVARLYKHRKGRQEPTTHAFASPVWIMFTEIFIDPDTYHSPDVAYCRWDLEDLPQAFISDNIVLLSGPIGSLDDAIQKLIDKSLEQREEDSKPKRWLRLAAEYFRIVLHSGHDGWDVYGYCHSLADLDQFRGCLGSSIETIATDPWFQANRSEMAWDEEYPSLRMKKGPDA